MKKQKFFVFTSLMLVLLAGMLLAGCTSYHPVSEHGTTVELAEKDYEILGRVEYVGTQKSILGIFRWDGATYRDLYATAVAQYSADDVINLSIDYKEFAIGIFYNTRGYVMTGLAIKYK